MIFAASVYHEIVDISQVLGVFTTKIGEISKMSAWAADGMARRGAGDPEEDEVSDGETANGGQHQNENGEADGAAAGEHPDYEEEDESKARRGGPGTLIMKAIVCALTGIAFGFIIEKSRGK